MGELLDPYRILLSSWFVAFSSAFYLAYSLSYSMNALTLILYSVFIISIMIGETSARNVSLALRYIRILRLPSSLWYCLVILSVYSLIVETKMIADGVGLDLPFLVRLRIGLSEESSLSVYSKYSLYLAFFSFGRAKSNAVKILMAIALICSLLLTTGRTFILLVVCLLLARYRFIHGRISWKGFIYLTVFGLLIFISFGVLLQKGSSKGGILEPILFYSGGGFLAFNEWIETFQNNYSYGLRTLSPVLSNVMVTYSGPTIVEDFITYPFRTNVYTSLRFAYEEFGLVFVVVTGLLIGYLSGFFWNRLRRGQGWVGYGCMIYILLLLPFQDQFWSIWPTWVTLAFFKILISETDVKRRYFIHRV